MSVDTSAPLYWKASVLDRFDGYGWQRALPGDPDAAPEVRSRSSVPGGGLERKHPGWVADATFELRALSSDLVIGTGLTESIDGLSGTLASGDGTLTHVGEPLERGDTYSVVAYVPQPTPDQLREAPVASSERRFNGSTLLSLPPADGVTQAPGPAVPMPLWGERDPTTTAQVLASPYGTDVPPRAVLDRRCADALRRRSARFRTTCAATTPMTRTSRRTPTRCRRSCSMIGPATASSSPGRWA